MAQRGDQHVLDEHRTLWIRSGCVLQPCLRLLRRHALQTGRPASIGSMSDGTEGPVQSGLEFLIRR